MTDARQRTIKRTGFIGIFTNIGLTVVKIIFGAFAASISMILDGVNNLTDALSSIITVIGAVVSGKAPDKVHPLGHGRAEYISSLFVGVIILVAAAMALSESIQKLITPEETKYTTISIIVLSISIGVKIALGLYTRIIGTKVNSVALKGAGIDALFDAIVTSATLVGAIVAIYTQVNIDGYLGILISLFIFKAGFGILMESIREILGKRLSPEISAPLKETILEFPEVNGVFDLYIDNFGPNKYIGSVHIEISANLTADQIDTLCRKISSIVYEKHHIILTVGIYAIDENDEELMDLRKQVYSIIFTHPEIIQAHGFKFFKENKTISIDIVQEFSKHPTKEVVNKITEELKAKFPEYNFYLVEDIDLTD